MSKFLMRQCIWGLLQLLHRDMECMWTKVAMVLVRNVPHRPTCSNHLAPSSWCCLKGLWNLSEAEPSGGSRSLEASLRVEECSLTSSPLSVQVCLLPKCQLSATVCFTLCAGIPSPHYYIWCLITLCAKHTLLPPVASCRIFGQFM